MNAVNCWELIFMRLLINPYKVKNCQKQTCVSHLTSNIDIGLKNLTLINQPEETTLKI